MDEGAWRLEGQGWAALMEVAIVPSNSIRATAAQVLFKCSSCQTAKPRSEFGKRKGGKRKTFRPVQFNCKECERDRHYRRKYGVPYTVYQIMVDKAGGVCEICFKSAGRLCLDHCHQTGKLRGILCVRCNSMLGSFEDPKWFSNAWHYLATRGQAQVN